MKNNEKSKENTLQALVEPERARRANGGSTNAPAGNCVPDPEVSEKAARRKFTAQYKIRILREADACTNLGQIGALLRREGLYSSNLTTWRRQLERGTLEALSPKRRGPKEKKSDPAARRIKELECEINSLQQRLKQAETIIEIQKKISEMLNIHSTLIGENR